MILRSYLTTTCRRTPRITSTASVRTARAGRAGRAITFIAGREVWKLQQIQRYTRSNIRREKVPTIDETRGEAEQRLPRFPPRDAAQAEYKRYAQTIDSAPRCRKLSNRHLQRIDAPPFAGTVREPQKILEDEPERPRQPYPNIQPRSGDTGGGGGGYRSEGPPRREYQQDRRASLSAARGGYGPPREDRPRPYGNRDDRPYPPRPAQDRPAGDRPYPAKPYGRPPFRKKPYGNETGGFYERSPGRKPAVAKGRRGEVPPLKSLRIAEWKNARFMDTRKRCGLLNATN
jgi:ATP-dependent RNA helicase DeaD